MKPTQPRVSSTSEVTICPATMAAIERGGTEARGEHHGGRDVEGAKQARRSTGTREWQQAASPEKRARAASETSARRHRADRKRRQSREQWVPEPGAELGVDACLYRKHDADQEGDEDEDRHAPTRTARCGGARLR